MKWIDETLNEYLLSEIAEGDKWEYIKPYLRPLESMTALERQELSVDINTKWFERK